MKVLIPYPQIVRKEFLLMMKFRTKMKVSHKLKELEMHTFVT